MASISRAQLLKELLPGLNALFGLEYDKYADEHTEIYDQESSDRSFEEETKLSGFGAAPVKKEGGSLSYDTAQESFSQRYDHETIAMGFSITEEATPNRLNPWCRSIRALRLPQVTCPVTATSCSRLHIVL